MEPVAHFSMALGATSLVAPKAPVWVLGAETQLPDLLFFGFEALGMEKKAETHLDMVFSHWLLDFIVYPNLPLAFEGSRLVGLGLITSGPGFIAGIILDLGLVVAGLALYLSRYGWTIV